MKCLFVAWFAIFAAVGFSDEEEKHPLDKKIDAAIGNAGSTAETIEATREGLKKWDAELNRVYQELKKKLPPEAWKELQESQRKWIEMRDSHVKFIAQMYGQFQGTIYVPMKEFAIMNVTRERALDLYRQLEILKEHGEQ
jgi:uncharacterized protein YecT (DUF1311 family)